jgi:acetyl esterase/lipase
LDTQIGVIYGRAGSVNLLLDFAKPQLCRNQKVPLVVYVHGGWWVGGSRTGMIYNGIARAFYQCGIAFASIDYRLTPAYQYKDIIGDCKLAIRYLRANAATFGIDPDKIAIWGGSAGGHLVSLMGTAGDDDGLEGPGYPGVSSRPAAVANDCGIQDLTSPWNSTSQMVITWFLGCAPQTCPDKAKEASPSWQASPDDPPILTLHGDHDYVVYYSQALALNKSLKNVGNKGAFICIINGSHGFGPYTGGVTVTPNGTRQAWLRFFHLIRYIEPGVLCDLNVDGQVNNTDANELNNLMGIYGINDDGLPTTPLWNTQADIYSDGRIDYKDWQTFAKKFTVTPKFTLEIIPQSQNIAAKDKIKFTVQIKNPGQLDIHDYNVDFSFPKSLEFVTASQPVAAGNVIRYSDSLLPAGQTRTFDLTFRLSNSYSVPQSGESFDLKAVMTSKIDTLPIDATAKITIPTISCMISASSSSVTSGQSVTYTLTVFNKSKYLATNINIWVDWTRDMSFDHSIPQGNLRGNKILFTLGSLGAGGREVFKVTLKVDIDCNANQLTVGCGCSSDQTYSEQHTSTILVTNPVPGSIPEITAIWDGIDTKTSIAQTGQPVKVKVTVTKGTSPYQVTVDWGDGNKKTAQADEKGKAFFENIYQTSGNFEVTIMVMDKVARQKVTKRRLIVN